MELWWLSPLSADLNAVLWIVVLTRLSRLFLIGLIVLQFFNGSFDTFPRKLDDPHLQFAASSFGYRNPFPLSTATMCLIIVSYVFFCCIHSARGHGVVSYAKRVEAGAWNSKKKNARPPCYAARSACTASTCSRAFSCPEAIK